MFDSLTPDELVQAMSNTLRSAASATPGSEFDQVQCLSGASIGRYLAQELAHRRELEAWFRDRVDDALTEAAASDDGSFGSRCHRLARRIRAADDIDACGGEIADYLRGLDELPATDGRKQATSLMHRCLRELADRQVRMLIGEYPGESVRR
jgi:hypothetical protein